MELLFQLKSNLTFVFVGKYLVKKKIYEIIFLAAFLINLAVALRNYKNYEKKSFDL